MSPTVTVKPSPALGYATHEKSLPTRATASRGLALSTAQVTTSRVLSLVGFLVLARLLTPAEYGTASLANVFVALLSLLAASGFSSVLVQSKTVERADLDTAFWLSAATGIALTGLLCAAAFPLAGLFDQPLLGPVLLALSGNFLVIGFTVVHSGLLQRQFRFGSLAKASVVGNVLATVVGIAFAALGFGVWALVVQTLLAPLTSSVLIWRMSDYRPRWAIDRDRIGPIYRQSSIYLGSSFVSFLSQYTDDFLIGARLGAYVLGVYTVGYRLMFVMIDVLANSLTAAALPVFARLQDAEAQLRRAYTGAIALSALVCMPCFVFALAAAPEIITVVFGSRWHVAVPLLRIFSIYGALEAVMTINSVFLQGVGKAGVVLRLSIAGTVLQVLGFVAAVHFGIDWVAGAYVLRSYVIAPFGLRRAARVVQLSTAVSIARIGKPAMAAMVMGVVVWVVGHESPPMPDAARLVMLLAVGAVVYATIALIAMRSHVAELRSMLTSLRSRQVKNQEVAVV